MRKIIFTRPDGGLSITSPTRNVTGDKEKTDLELEERAFNKLPFDAINPKYIDEADVPVDRIFRDALEDIGGKPVHSLSKAKLIAHDMRREKRDIDMQPFDEIIAKDIPGQNKAAAEANRLIIRNADAVKQINIDNAINISELKVVLNG